MSIVTGKLGEKFIRDAVATRSSGTSSRTLVQCGTPVDSLATAHRARGRAFRGDGGAFYHPGGIIDGICGSTSAQPYRLALLVVPLLVVLVVSSTAAARRSARLLTLGLGITAAAMMPACAWLLYVGR